MEKNQSQYQCPFSGFETEGLESKLGISNPCVRVNTHQRDPHLDYQS